MNTNIIKFVACLAWAGAAVSSTTSANALAITTQSGSYASCSANYTTSAQFHECSVNNNTDTVGIDTYYMQTIKFVYTTCNSGGCSSDTGTVYTDIIYASGRKTTSLVTSCFTSGRRYGLGTCSC
jgi:hypothetical protein